MTALGGKHEISSVGVTKTATTGATTASTQILASASGAGPRTYIVYCDQDTYVRQGGSAVTATNKDFLYKANSYLKVTVHSHKDDYLAYLQVSAAGTIRITENSSLDPGTGTSA